MMPNPKTATIVITGTHHTPAIELIRQLKNDTKTHWKIEYIGHIYPTETHIKNTIISKLKINFHQLETGKYDRRYLLHTIKDIPKTLKAVIKSYQLIKEIKPQIVVSFGGYVSVPVVFSSFLQGIPSITHEQTLTNSLSTKINSLFTNKIALSFKNPSQISNLPSKKVTITGNLLRHEISNNFTKTFSNITKPFLYITGGNQGSDFINNLITQNLPLLTKKFSIIHQTGNKDVSIKPSSRYFPTQYIGLENIGWVLNNSSIIIGRSGANICQEIVALTKKSILIPHPATQQNEQLKNAQWVKKNLPRSTFILHQNEITSETFLKAINKLYLQKTTNRHPSYKSNYKLLELIYELI